MLFLLNKFTLSYYSKFSKESENARKNRGCMVWAIKATKWNMTGMIGGNAVVQKAVFLFCYSSEKNTAASVAWHVPYR